MSERQHDPTRQGWTLLELNRPAEAEQTFRVALSQDPADAEALWGLGSALLRQKRWDEAITALRECVAAAPAAAHPMSVLSRALAEVGDQPEEALGWARRAVDLAPEDWFVHEGLAAVLVEQEPPSVLAAHESARRSVELAPHEPSGHIMVGVALLRMGETERARQAWENALALDPTNVIAHNNLAVIDRHEGRPEAAAGRLVAAAALDPHEEVLHQNLVDLRREARTQAAVPTLIGLFALVRLLWLGQWVLGLVLGLSLIGVGVLFYVLRTRALPDAMTWWGQLRARRRR